MKNKYSSLKKVILSYLNPKIIHFFTLSPTWKLSSFFKSIGANGVGVEVDTLEFSRFIIDGAVKPGLSIFDPEGSVPVPELELVEATEVGRGRLLILKAV